MNNGRITRHIEPRITAYTKSGVLDTEPVHNDWANFVSQRSVRAIAVAPKSRIIWLATWGGVFSWNRKEKFYQRYSSEHGLAGNAVSCLCLDRDEQPWVGHVEGGLSYFNGHCWRVHDSLQMEPIRAICNAGNKSGIWAAGSETVYRIFNTDQSAIPVAKNHDGAVDALTLLADGRELLIGNPWGLFRLQQGKEPIPKKREVIQSCNALTTDRYGFIWIGTSEGLYRLNGKKLEGPYIANELGSVGKSIIGLAAGRKRIWILTQQGLGQLSNDQWIPVSWPSENTSRLTSRTIVASTDDNYLWVGTDEGLAGVQIKGKKALWERDWLRAHPDDKLNNAGHCITSMGGEGHVWVGTSDGLVLLGPGDKWSRYLEGSDIRYLVVSPNDPEALWILAWPHGIFRLTTQNRSATHMLQPPGLPNLLAIGQDDHIYSITQTAMWKLKTDKYEMVAEAVPSLPRCLVQTSDRVWWLGTTEGIYRLVNGAWELAGEQPGPIQGAIYALTVVNKILWAATEIGLWSRQADHWKAHSITSHAKNSRISTLAPAGNSGELWVAHEGGVMRYNPATGKTSVLYTPVNTGLASRQITAILQNERILWIVTRAGISRLKMN